MFVSKSLFGLCLFLFWLHLLKVQNWLKHDWKHPNHQDQYPKEGNFSCVPCSYPGSCSAVRQCRDRGSALGVRCIKLMNSWQLRIAAWCGWYWWCLVILVSQIWDIATGIFNIQIGKKIYESFPNSSHRAAKRLKLLYYDNKINFYVVYFYSGKSTNYDFIQ